MQYKQTSPAVLIPRAFSGVGATRGDVGGNRRPAVICVDSAASLHRAAHLQENEKTILKARERLDTHSSISPRPCFLFIYFFMRWLFLWNRSLFL